jgi:hypothetical protein
MKCHNTFHVSKIKPYKPYNRSFPQRSVPTYPSPTITEEGFEEFVVEKILDKQISGHPPNQSIKYLVRWKGYDNSFDSWEPESFLSNCQALDDYENKPSSSRVPINKPSSTPPSNPSKRKSPRNHRNSSINIITEARGGVLKFT